MASSKRNYDVFLSFRGTDVRNNFLSHLYADLDRSGIHTFKDSEELRKGEEISPTLMMAIEESRVAIVIFSEDYASSRWCLEELVKIMECKAQKDLIVLPVFYKVEPREVRRVLKGYGRAMAMHESDSEKDPKAVERWKQALSDAGSLSGWDYNNEDEVEFIRGITKQVSSHLERKTPLYVAKYPVGIDYRAQEVISLSQKESDGDDVLMIGIWGPGGIGKTAIAKAIYNAMERHFEGSTFLERVRETSNKCNGLVELQEKILSQILSPRDLTVYSEGRGSGLIRERLGHKKVLLVLDDVDNCHQLDMLAGGDNWFGKGSRIFVTSRDKHLLTSHGKNRVYEVKPLHHGEALSLFSQHAFPNCKKPEIREDLIDRALHYASGFPLALEVLGSFLRGRREPAWESGLRKLSKSPDKDINQVLKISFDGLEENEREICLDFACFFKGKSIEYIKKVLDGCGFETTIGLEILIDRSLIREEHGTLQMHDLVQLMVQNIVNQECPDDPGKRSRLWLFDDVQDILYEDTETNAVKAIVLDLPAPKVRTVNPEEITICPNAFRNMKMLRMLILIEVHFSSQGPVYLPNNLRWLEWPNAPDLEFRSGPKKLVALDIPKSHIRQFDGIFKDFKLLKYINFSQCESLVSVPDLSSIPNLESLNLDGCKSLVEVHQSVACHKLKLLSLECCSNLSKFPHKLKAKSLRALNLFGCFKLEKFSDIPEKMEHLEYLDLSSTAIEELPASVENLVSVKIINLRKCKRLPTLPSSVYKLQNLEVLSLGGCSNFVMFPKNLEDSINPNGNLGFRNLYQLDLYDCSLSEVEFLESSSSFPKLGHLRLDGNKFTHLPTCINKYHNLEHLHVSKCGQLQKIPQLPPNVHILKAYGCSSLQEFPDLSSRSSNWLSGDVSSCCQLFHKGASTAHVLSCKELPKMIRVDITLTGGEMPEWFLHCKDSYIPFMVPGDLRLKFLGIAFCIVLRQGKAVSAQFTIGSNQHNNSSYRRDFPSMTSDNMWIVYLSCWEMLIDGELPWDKWDRIKVWVSTGTRDRWGLNFIPGQDERLIKWGFRPIIAQEEDDLRIVLQHHQPNETNWSSEERDSEEDNRIDTKEEESSSETDDDSNKEKLSQPNETNWSSEERDSEEDYCTDTEEEESSSETDWQSYEEMWQDSELPCELLPDMHCCESGCRTFKSWKKLMDRQRRIYRKFVQLNGQRLHG